MSENKELLNRLKRLLPWKESNAFYAKKLNISEQDVRRMTAYLKYLDFLDNGEEEYDLLDSKVTSYDENLKDGTAELTFDTAQEIKTLDDLKSRCNIDDDKWEITRYIQNYWGNGKDPHWQVKAWMNKKSDEQIFRDNFLEFLEDYRPSPRKIHPPNNNYGKPLGCLLLNKQDAHINKYDINGNNDIQERFDRVYNKLDIILKQARLSHNLERLIYILGSDEFNSEFTNCTTKGTPQENILPYHETFEKICEHETHVINLLLENSEKVDIIYVPGNHDEYIGWHLVNWLKTYYRDEKRLTIDDSPSYRKYTSYGSSALMFNHGDAIKNAKLAGLFPLEYKKTWSEHNFFYAFTGDLHIETSENVNGIKFYRVAAFSSSVSKWEDKHGFVDCAGEATGFIIDREQGMTNIFKYYL